MELIGTVKKVSDIQTFGSGFQKRELVLLTQEQYPQPINIEFVQDKVSLLDQVSIGEDVKVSINIRGREWTSPDGVVKYFNSIVGWRIEKFTPINSNEPTQPAQHSAPANTSAPANDNVFDDEDDDLPF